VLSSTILLAKTFTACMSPESLAMLGPKLPVVVPLFLGCFVVVVAVPWAAARGKLHVPGYVGLAFLAFALGLLLGRISGVRGVAGTPWGVFLSVVFFLLMATAMGSILALFFYRHPPEM
jgi:hypothetical protein